MKVLPYAYPLASQSFKELLVVTEPGCDLGTDRLHQLGLRYTAKRRLAALERPEAKDRWRIPMALWTALKTCSPGDSIRIKQTWDSFESRDASF